jgi:Fic family protein
MWVADEHKHLFELETLEQIRFRVDRFLLMPKHEAWLRREAFVRQAYSSTMIENASISQEELARAESELSIERPDVANYASALEFVDFLSNQRDTPIDERTIRQIHWTLMRGVRDDHYLPGEYRNQTNWIEDAGVKVYEPPHQVDVPILMRRFVEALKDNTLHPVLKAGVTHLHLVAIHPFVDGNGRTARLLATLLLQSNGWGFRNLLSLDSYYQRNRDEYIGALSATLGNKMPEEYDATPWLQFFCRAVLIVARRLESHLTDWQMLVDQLHQELRPLGLLDRQIDGLLYASRKGEITRRDYVEITGVSPLTATRDLVVLVERGQLVPEGSGRSRLYRVKTVARKEEEEQAKLL